MNEKFEDTVKEIKSDTKATRDFNLGILISTIAGFLAAIGIGIAMVIGISQIVTSIKLADNTNQTNTTAITSTQDTNIDDSSKNVEQPIK